MKILKYKKSNGNEYKIYTDKEVYTLYDDIIIKYGLLLKKEISEKEFTSILNENNKLQAYYVALKNIETKLRSEKELKIILQKKEFNSENINYALERLNKEGYLDHNIYIEAYIHDKLLLNTEGESKILKDLEDLGFKYEEIIPLLNKIDKYILKKLKSNKKSALEFKNKIMHELINKGFSKEDIQNILSNIDISNNEDEISKIVNKLYQRYSGKYDEYTTKLKIKNYLYQKGYTNIDVEKYLK